VARDFFEDTGAVCTGLFDALPGSVYRFHICL